MARMGKGGGVYRVLVGKLEGKRPLRRPRRRWEDIIKMDLQEVGCGGRDWIELAQDRDRWRVMNLPVPKNAGNSLTSCKLVSFSRRTLLLGVWSPAYIYRPINVSKCIQHLGSLTANDARYSHLTSNPGLLWQKWHWARIESFLTGKLDIKKERNQTNATYGARCWMLLTAGHFGKHQNLANFGM